ncbi:GNAT family N-acetyltransferase [Mesorhizobium hawassense]|uniref:GNAT family N-acetyltransferase n=1 Tax=Mesorhizobium hawassense TaxID=1209954 RepID=A0A330HSA9_9HYPH|nr:GNAT family N-acetyltransferase [Mesorhizobium hawassense]RAZ91551.1 GNAT family N-acetyltransferase [Mesorhizobium hawassense]
MPTGQLHVRPPERLTVGHDVSEFRNGKHGSLDDWLRNRALSGEGLSARTYVVCDAGTKDRVVGYYAISTAMEERVALPSAKLRRGMPEQVPLLLIGRLAVDQAFQGMGLGGDLLSDALRRCLAVSEIAGVRAVVTHAIDDDAVGFYRLHGFVLSPLGERVILMPVETVQGLFSKV